VQIEWTVTALLDVERLFQFLVSVNPAAAKRFKESLTPIPQRLEAHPRQGPVLEAFDGREVRRLLIGNYEMRHEIVASTIFILRIWHTREDR
jgi:plasmid stabilization system protein ParE